MVSGGFPLEGGLISVRSLPEDDCCVPLRFDSSEKVTKYPEYIAKEIRYTSKICNEERKMEVLISSWFPF